MKKIMKGLMVISAFAVMSLSSVQNVFAQEIPACPGDFWFDKFPLNLKPGETYEKVFDMRGCSQACFSFVSATFPLIKKPKINTEVIVDGEPARNYENLYPMMQREAIITYRFSLPAGAKAISTVFQTRYSYQTCASL